MPIILASRSRARLMLLTNAGLEVTAEPADFDERAAEAPLLEEGLGADDIAAVLAMLRDGSLLDGLTAG